MPVYMFNAKPGTFDDEAKAKIAADLTRIYCAVTGAPSLFVNAFFFEDLSLMPLGAGTATVLAGTRKGWSDDQKAQIAGELKESIAQHASVAPDGVQIVFRDTPASWAMEGGKIMAEPGNDAAWLAAREEKVYDINP